MTENAWNNVLAALVLAATVVLLVAAPHPLLRPLAIGTFAVGVLGVLGARLYYRRLHETVAFLSRPENLERPELLLALLSRPERVILGVSRPGDAKGILRTLRGRQSLVLSAGMGFGLSALVSFLLLAYLFDL
ncbi:MAG: hypothetical protein U0529_10550 [Thermoanaerobaculia bacterium]